MTDRTDEIRAEVESDRFYGMRGHEVCTGRAIYLLAVNARLRKVADAAREVIYDTQLDGIGVDSDRRLGALSATLDALGDGDG